MKEEMEDTNKHNKEMDDIKLDSVSEAIKDFKAGKFVVVVDDEDRENEGDLIIAAEKITPEDVNFMLKNARGVLCAPITNARCKELCLERQVEDNTSVLGTPFTVTVDKLEDAAPVFPYMTGLPQSVRSQIRKAGLRHSGVRDISIRFTHRIAECSSEQDTLRRLLIWRVLPDCIRRRHLWRS